MKRFVPAAAVCALFLAAPAFAQDLKVTRADGTSATISAEALADLPRAQVTVAGGSGRFCHRGEPSSSADGTHYSRTWAALMWRRSKRVC